MLAAHTLEIADIGKRTILRLRKKAFGRSVQKGQFPTKERGALFGQTLDQVFQHGSQAPVDLNAASAVMTDFGDRQVDIVFPVWRAIDESKPVRCISHAS